MFAKIFESLWGGSMVGQPDAQLVFVFLLAHSNRDGFVDEHPSKIAALTGLPAERVEVALRLLEAEDPASRSPEEAGRRILLVDAHRAWGWLIVNHAKYRAMRDEEQRREEARARMRRRRANSSQDEPEPRTVRRGSPRFAHADADTEAEKIESTDRGPSGPRSSAESPGDPGQAEQARRLVEGLSGRLRLPASGGPGPRPHVDPVAALVKPYGDAAVRTALQLTNRLYGAGIRTPACLIGIVEHWLANRDKIRNPWAYFAPGGPGAEAIAGICAAKAAVDEHEAFKRADAEWFRKGGPGAGAAAPA